jgi:GT2 family glycosyltransferase
MSLPIVYIVIINWENFKETIECLDSLKKISYQNYRIVIVDNGSKNDSVQILRKNYPQYTLIQSKKNLGFAGGNNLGIKYALKQNAQYILLLNNDVVVKDNFLEPLIEFAEKDSMIGVVQPKILKKDNPQLIDSCGQEIFDDGKVGDIGASSSDRNLPEPKEIFGACAAAALFKSIVFKKSGIFDESFFIIFEDVDLSFRIRLKGYKTFLVPGSVVLHKRGVSSELSIDNLKFFYHNRNLLFLLLKYWPLKCFWKYKKNYLKIFLKTYYFAFKNRFFFRTLLETCLKIKERKNFQKNLEIKSLHNCLKYL